MVDGGHVHAAPLHPLAVLGGDAVILPDDGLGGDAPKADDDLWLDQSRLAAEIPHALLLLLGQGVTVFRRAAFHHVGDIDLGAVKADDLQHIVQQLTGLAHEGHALLILALTRPFADEEDLRILRSHAEDHIGPGRGKGTGGAGHTFTF